MYGTKPGKCESNFSSHCLIPVDIAGKSNHWLQTLPEQFFFLGSGVVFFLNSISIGTGITLSKLLAVVRSEMCTQGLIGWIIFFSDLQPAHPGPQALKSSVHTGSHYLGLRTPLDMRMPISSVPFSDCPIEKGLSTISCVTLMTMFNISFLRNEAMI